MTKIQHTYNRLIRMANISYIQSNEEVYKPLHRELIAKTEAFEAAADCLYSSFTDEINPVETMRFKEIRKHHLNENDETHKTQKEHDTLLSCSE